MKVVIVALLSFALYAEASIDHIVPTGEVVQGEYIVRLHGNLGLYNKSDIEKSLGVEVVRKISPISDAVLVRTGSEKAALRSLSANPMVAHAEPNYIVKIQTLPNDPDLSRLWGMINTGNNDPRGLPGLAGMDANVAKAWEITTGSHDVVVAVIDTGVDANHLDLKNNIWINEAEANGTPGVDDDGNGYIDDIHGYDFVNDDGNPADDHGHGTHVAGTIAAEGNNGRDVVGVAWKARIMGVKFLSASGSGSLSDAVSAIDYATQMGAHLSNNSWGGGGYSEELNQAIARAAAANSLFVVAAGNSSTNVDAVPAYPCAYEQENVLCVAALDPNGALANFSSYGKTTVDVAAPGRNILSTVPGGLDIYSGTSMATPHVSGAAALLLSENPGMRNADLIERVIRTARRNYRLNSKVVSNGMLDVYALLTNATAQPDPEDPQTWNQMSVNVSTPHPYPQNYSETFVIEVPGAERFVVYFDKFEMENTYDTVTFKDESGKVLGTLSGFHTDSYSPQVAGTKVFIEVKADHSVNAYGFDITKVYYK